MKCYEVFAPYYALLRAEDKDHALLEYNASVAGLEDVNEIHEVPEDYALVRLSQTPGEDKELLNPTEVLKMFRNPNRCVLLWDSALL